MNYTRQPPKEVQLPARLPLVGVVNQRMYDPSTDSRLINGYVEVGEDEVLRVVKRPGLLTSYSVVEEGGDYYGAGMYGRIAIFYVPVEGGYQGRLYSNGTFVANVGSYSAPTTSPPDRYFSFEFVPYRDGGVIFFHNKFIAYTIDDLNAIVQVPFLGSSLSGISCSITSGSAVVNTASTALLTVYSVTTGTGIPADTFIESIDSPTQFTLSAPATTTNASASLSFALGGPGYIGPKASKLVDGVVDLNKSTYLFTAIAQVQGSDLDTPYAWNPLNSLFAYANQDEPVAITKQLSYIIALKHESVEFFRDAGLSPGSPLERLEGMRMDVGCFAGRTVQTIDGTVLWASTTESGLKSVWALENLKPREVATPAVRRMLESMSPEFAISFSIIGHCFYALTDSVKGITLVYDLTTNYWSYWKGFAEPDFSYVGCTYHNGKTLLQHRKNGSVVELLPASGVDNGAPVTMDIYPPQYDAGMRVVKYLNRMYAICDRGLSTDSFQVRINDNDQAAGEWSPWRTFDLTHPRPAIWQCGSFTKRWFHFRHTGGAVRLTAIELDLLPGTL